MANEEQALVVTRELFDTLILPIPASIHPNSIHGACKYWPYARLPARLGMQN